MTVSNFPANPPSLRTTRSRINPTVTLYSLDPQNVPIQVESRASTTSSTHALPTEEAASRKSSGEKSRFFADKAESTPKQRNRGNIDEKTDVEEGTPRKRRKIVATVEGDAVAPALASPSSSSSSLSPPPHVESSALRVTVKPEPPATPLRRVPRAQRTLQKNAAVKAEAETPLRVVKEESGTPARTPKVKKEAKPRTKTPIKLKLDKPHPEPPRWRRQYQLIEKMREKIVAPVDTLGCETPNRERTDDPKTVRFHMLISLMLSSQTKDPVTSQAVTNLHAALPGGLTASSLAAAPAELVAECINKVGFWRRKTEYIQDAARRIVEGGLDDGEVKNEDIEGIREEYGDIPRTLNGLVKLKGVGPKMAFLALQCAWNINAGVGVDVHVHRITNRLGWHKPKTTEPEQTRLNLESWLPPHLFKPINHVLVGFGQVVCLPVGPRCDVCLLGTERICPSRVANVNIKGRKVVEFGFLATGLAESEEAKDIIQTVKGEGPTSATGPILKRIEIEIGTDPSPSMSDLASMPKKQEPQIKEEDEIAAAVAEPGIGQPELVDMVMQELAREQGEDVLVLKAE